MKKIIASIAAVAAIAFAGAASAATGDYVQATGGSQFWNNYGGGATWTVAAGRQFGPVRAEVEYLGANIGHYGNAQTGNLNAYYEPVSFGKLTPFVGAGIGYGRVVNSETVVLNAQVGATYPLTAHIKAVADYRFAGIQANGEHTSAASLGLRYTF